jgi:polyisoprenoid-binding protein YceI
MKLKQNIELCLAVAALAVPGAFSQQLAVDFDKSASKINWTLGGNVHTVHGTFQLKQGHLNVDPSTGKVDGEFIIETASGESGDSSRDKKMQKDVLESDKFPEIRLKVTKLDGVMAPQGTSTVKAIGQLTIHGASHEVTIPVQVTVNGSELTGKGTFEVPYVDWGMRNPSNFLFKVNKTVEMELSGVGHLTH